MIIAWFSVLKGRFYQPRVTERSEGTLGYNDPPHLSSTLKELFEAAMPQSLAKAYLHVIFSTKNREPVLLDAWREELFKVIGGALNNLGCQSLIVGGVADHVHALFQLSRTLTIADAIKGMKTPSSAWINQRHPAKTYFHWQQGYGAFSVSQSNLDLVRAYILNQSEHHKTQSFQDEFREWLRKYEIEWDERYVWD